MTDPTTADAKKPTIRLLLHLARTGGTIISKCVAVMPRVALLSEIHPAGLRNFNPLRQAHQWYGLITLQDIEKLRRAGDMQYVDAIDLVWRRSEARNLRLVIRDWNHLDFHGPPYLLNPKRTLMNSEMLATRFRLLRVTTVRHPIDHWLSLSKLPAVAQKLSFEQFCEGCLGFAEHAAKIGFVRYEDFTREPAAQMQRICSALDISFDPAFEQRWPEYKHITGDKQGSRGGLEKIVSLPRKPVDPGLLERFDRNASYHKANELLGYKHPE